MPVRYRRSPHVICYWDNGQLVFENYARRTRVAAAPVTCDVLDFFSGWRSAGELSRRLPQADADSLARAVAALLRVGLLERSDSRDPREKAFATWSMWSPAASFFHFSTKDAHGRMVPAATMRRLRRRARVEPMPPATKRYRRAASVILPRPDVSGPLPHVLLERRTWRTFSRRPIAVEAVGTLLGLTFGVQTWKDIRGIGRLALKTSPSGGSRHPIEAYVLALRVDGLRRGLYHYDAAAHRLEHLRPHTSARELVGLLNGQSWFGGAALGLIMTAVFRRTQWEYQASRAYRAVLIEAGHVCQTFCLLATSLGLAPFCTMALSDSKVERSLGIDGVTESALYAAGVGSRPTGMTRPPWGVPLHPHRAQMFFD